MNGFINIDDQLTEREIEMLSKGFIEWVEDDDGDLEYYRYIQEGLV